MELHKIERLQDWCRMVKFKFFSIEIKGVWFTPKERIMTKVALVGTPTAEGSYKIFLINFNFGDIM